MKRHIQKTGIRKYFGRDFTELQGEPLKALDGFFAEYGACIINGCRADAVGSKFDVSSGLVALEATDPETGVSGIKVMPFEGASDVALPLYLTASATVVDRVYGDGKVKPVAYDYKAVGSTVRPSGAYIAVTTDGGNRFVDAVQDPKHQFVTDTEKATWNAKETPAGAQTKATTAETNAKAYTDTREIAIRQTVTSGDSSTLASAKSYTDTEVGKVNTSLGGHTGDNTRHITAAERGSWNAKETPTGAQAKATAAENNAKAYADTREGAINTRLAGKLDKDSDIIIQHGDVLGGKWIKQQIGGYDTVGLHLNRSIAAGIWSQLDVYTRGSDGFQRRAEIFEGGGRLSGHSIWHSGNFDPAAYPKTDVKGWRVERNCDLMTGPGTYDINPSEAPFVNAPFYNYGQIVVSRTSSAVAQVAFMYNTGDMYCRSMYGTSAWSPWRLLWHSGNFDPASKVNKSGDTMTGSLTIYNSSDNDGGHTVYCRDGDGTAINNRINGVTTAQIRLYNNGRATLWFNDGSDQYSDIWHSGNFDPATKADTSHTHPAATTATPGLMPAADKAKLDMLPKNQCFGRIGADGGMAQTTGVLRVEKKGNGWYRIYHNYGHSGFGVTANVINESANHKSDNVITIGDLTSAYFDISVGNGANAGSYEDSAFFFQTFSWVR